ncbi:glycosyltransferase family 2 protein [Aspergillus vadensis CBS 113365]|uniref:Nucleotide-diphospho-sugar transferase n=1 Tax=Aspergillus vadensis (strain CBS 113365 / IMI 142717 / IBT 24658) TaxID=1448311 RepID=A0A319D2Y9_ASPVC|nr:nucleotide-diphospho-sugar transferase [Aspergillus vadensis CBS 113365]PYH74482.1 nucleotide-diphospho-sugar transferase [Aspergillus vadensis CBS 113365]
MEPAIIRFAQANVSRVRMAGLFFCPLYMAVRLSCLICATETNYWMWMILILEAFWTYQSLLIKIPRRTERTPKKLHLARDDTLPSVDILLPCCGEPVDIIRDTIRATCVIDYPQSAFRVLVLDDGNSPALQQAVEELRQTWPNLLYYSRGTKPSQKVFAKAGNLNFGLFDIQGSMDKPPEYIALFDSDFLPAPNFLRATLPHLLRDDSVGLVGTRQDYYNLPPRDPIGQNMAIFWEVYAPWMNETGSSMVSTSGCVMRRDLAVEVGGFPTINEVEDLTLSILLPAYGKRVVYLTEMLQLGRVPTSLEGHVRQNRRWITGLVQLIGTPWAPSRESIPTSSRYHMALFGIVWLLTPLIQVVGCATIASALVSRQQLVPHNLLQVQIPLSLVSFGLIFLYEWLKAAATGFLMPAFAHFGDLWICADRLWTVIQFHIFGLQAGRSVVTGSAQNSWNNPNMVPTRMRQLKRDLWDSGVGFNVLFVIGTLAGIFHSVMDIVERYHPDWQFRLMTTLLYPPVVLIPTVMRHMAASISFSKSSLRDSPE